CRSPAPRAIAAVIANTAAVYRAEGSAPTDRGRRGRTLFPSIRDVPRHRRLDAGEDGVAGGVAEQALRLADVGLGVADVAGAEVAVDRGLVVGHAVLAERLAQRFEELIEGGAVADGDVVHLVAG